MAEEEKARTASRNEENHKLIGSEQPSQYYGSTSHVPVSSSNTSSSSLAMPLDDACSDGESSEEFMSSNKLAKRKKKRLQKHHRPARPKLVSKLSHIVRSARQSEDEQDADDIIEMPTDNLIIPELDPNAAEVRESVPFGFGSARRHRVNLSNIREKYRDARIHERYGNVPLTNFERTKNLFQFDAYVSEAKRILFANRSIILFVYTDLMVDVLLCLAYLVEMKQEADIHATPPWLFKWRSYDLWFYCTTLSFWNLGSFVMRIFLTGRPIYVLLSFRAFIETLTTVPFMLSIFMSHGQYLYVPYFLRSWVLLLRIKSVSKIKTNLLMTAS
ncbi:hypothetical protein BD560DRAFT_143204 [Blakeslea trispora]|nr:hypothetical protein BD560DRAFT_143204 [Blakeslea trispora]